MSTIYISPTGKTIAELSLDNNTYVIENNTGEITATIVNSMYQNIINSLPFSGSTNLNISNPNVNDILQYNGTKWVNKAISENFSLSGLTDVDINNPVDYQILQFTGGTWQNITIPGTTNTYQNGLSSYFTTGGTFIELGGTLIKNTIIKLSAYTFSISGGTIQYSQDLSKYYTSRSLVDFGFVGANFLSANTSVLFVSTGTTQIISGNKFFIGGLSVTGLTIDGVLYNSNNFLSANTSFYTQTQTDSNFLSANTSIYTQSQIDNNFLSANTSGNWLSANTSGNWLSANTSYIFLTTGTTQNISGLKTFTNGLISNKSSVDSNEMFGKFAGNSTMSGSYNTFIGYKSGSGITSASHNTYIGYETGIVQNGGNNTFIGSRSGKLTTGYHNTFIGDLAGGSNVGGYNNTFIGKSAGSSNSSGYDNVVIGTQTSENSTTGYKNVYIGDLAGQNSNTGNSNVYVGYAAGQNASGKNNVFLGFGAGSGVTENNKFELSNTIQMLLHGEFSTDSYYPPGFGTSSSGPLIFVNGKLTFRDLINITSLSPIDVYWASGGAGELGYTTSSIKYKTGITNMEDTTWIYDLRPVNFEFKDNLGIKQYGMIAEEVASINDYFVFKINNEIEGINYRDFISPIINEIQRLNKCDINKPKVTDRGTVNDYDFNISLTGITGWQALDISNILPTGYTFVIMLVGLTTNSQGGGQVSFAKNSGDTEFNVDIIKVNTQDTTDYQTIISSTNNRKFYYLPSGDLSSMNIVVRGWF